MLENTLMALLQSVKVMLPPPPPRKCFSSYVSSVISSFWSPLFGPTAIRKLTEKRRTVEGKLERRDITNDYATFQSEAYAPLTRHGVFMDKGSEQYAVKSKYLSTYRGKDCVQMN